MDGVAAEAVEKEKAGDAVRAPNRSWHPVKEYIQHIPKPWIPWVWVGEVCIAKRPALYRSRSCVYGVFRNGTLMSEHRTIRRAREAV